MTASIDLASLFSDGSAAELLIYFGLLLLAFLNSLAAFQMLRAVAPNTSPWLALSAAVALFAFMGMFLPVLTKLVVLAAARLLHFAATRLLPLRRLVVVVVLPLFIASLALQLSGT